MPTEDTTGYLDHCWGGGNQKLARWLLWSGVPKVKHSPSDGSFITTMVLGRSFMKDPTWKVLWVHSIPWIL